VTIPRPHTNVNTSKHRILVVDDNKDSADSLSMLLRVKGHEVRTARDGLQAIEITPDFLPNVILMDIGMPKLNGYDTTRQIRTLPSGKDVMIIALTGWGQPEDLRQSTEAGCSAHLVKPIDLAELERLLLSPYSSAS
jgi:CheY-like chemotaxis protein